MEQFLENYIDELYKYNIDIYATNISKTVCNSQTVFILSDSKRDMSHKGSVSYFDVFIFNYCYLYFIRARVRNLSPTSDDIINVANLILQRNA